MSQKTRTATARRRADETKFVPATPAPIGRPTVYRDSYPEQAAKLCALGATDEDIADFFGVTIRTISRWQVEYEEFCLALKDAKEVANNRVERSLYQRAVGYTYDAVKIMTSAGKEMVVPYREHVPPDVTAQIFWLKNRRRDQWRDRSEKDVNHTVSFGEQFERYLRDLTERKRNGLAIEYAEPEEAVVVPTKGEE